MATFRVALSGDFRHDDDTPAFPDFDLRPLLEDSNIEVDYVAPVDGVMPASGLEGFDALILLAARFSTESAPADGRLALVARFGVGYDTVALDVCNQHGIAAVITPDGVRRPVAVAVITFILSLAGKLMAKDRITRRGPAGWTERTAHMGVGLVGRTLGSLGVGNIGSEVFRLAQPFDMVHIAHDPYVDPSAMQELGVRLVELDELFRESDFLSVSCPLTDETRGIVNAERLATMKPSAYLINTARGPVVDQRALTATLREGRIAGAGLDVFEAEPTPENEALHGLDNVILTPHSLCWTNQCFAGIGADDVRAAIDVMHGRVPRGVVNREITENAHWRAKLESYKTQFGE